MISRKVAFLPVEWKSTVSGFSASQEGMLARLSMAYFASENGLTSSPERLVRIACAVTPSEVEDMNFVVQNFFTEASGSLVLKAAPFYQVKNVRATSEQDVDSPVPESHPNPAPASQPIDTKFNPVVPKPTVPSPESLADKAQIESDLLGTEF